MGSFSWNRLPPVLLLEVYSYLNRGEKIQASTTCKQWRNVLFHSDCFEDVTLNIRADDDDGILRTRFLVSRAYRRFRKLIVNFDSMNPLCVRELAKVLKKVCTNTRLQNLVLVSSHSRMECPGRNVTDQQNFFDGHIEKALVMLLSECPSLEVLNMSCLENVIDSMITLMGDLSRRYSHSLRVLNLASVKDNPDNYSISNLDTSLFQRFHKLQVLSLDYDYMSDDTLRSLCGFGENQVGGLLRLNIHVHGVHQSHPGTTDIAWTTFTQNNPNCQLRLTLIHSYEAVDILDTDILKSTMPLTHLKVLFCEQLNMNALRMVSQLYREHLQCLWWIDSLECNESDAFLIASYVPDPLVRVAWKCLRLEELVLSGYKYLDEDLIGIARLRGSALKKLDIPAANVVYDIHNVTSFCAEMSQALERDWKPLELETLPEVILNPEAGDSDEFVIPVVTKDQEFIPTV